MGELPEGKCKVKLEHGGEMLEVDEEDVERVSNHGNTLIWGGSGTFTPNVFGTSIMKVRSLYRRGNSIT